MLEKHIELAREFHLKNELQVGSIDQFGMFERNNLLLEEIGELIEAFNLHVVDEVKSEALDVYYIVLGTFVALGINEVTSFEKKFAEFELEKDELIIAGSQIAQATRRRYEKSDYKNEIIELSKVIIKIVYSMFKDESELERMYISHHMRVMKKERRKIGDTYVISNFN